MLEFYSNINKEQVTLFFILLTVVFIIYKKTRLKYSHKWRRKSSKKVLNKIQNMENAQVFGYLRKVDPFVVEELILDCLEQREDVKVIRNKRYTGDLGIDGAFVHTEHINDKQIKRKYVIQVKRYKSYINPKHLEEFKQHIKREKAHKGLFIHTGKTSKNSFNIEKSEDALTIISGNKLIELLRNKTFSFSTK